VTLVVLDMLNVCSALHSTRVIIVALCSLEDVRANEQGKFEERLPFLAVRVPDWFTERYPHAAAHLRLNSHRLTTPFDVHETLLDVLDMERPRDVMAARARGYSLFQDIPEDRTCADAGIEPHWSASSTYLTLSLHARTLVQRASDLTVSGFDWRSRRAGLGASC